MNQPTTRPRTAAAALSDHIDTRTAAMEVAHELHDALGAERGDTACDLLLMFGSFHHIAAFAAAGETMREVLKPRSFLACTAESVLGVDREWEGRAGLTALAMRLPGAGTRLHTFSVKPGDTSTNLNQPNTVRELVGYGDDVKAILMLADPFTTPTNQILTRFGYCGGKDKAIPITGGMASGSSQPGRNVLIANGEAQQSGLVAVTIAGDIEVDCLVSQGCRPIGEPLVVTKCDENVLLELGGRPAMEVVQETAQELGERERELLSKGLLIGVVIDEYKERFGRGDFLIRGVMGIDQNRKAIAVGEKMRVGQTIQLHVRDADTATEDLQLLLDLQEVKGQPFAAAAFTCNGRGTRLFPEANHDIDLLTRRLGSEDEQFPVAGFFAGGEIGPIGDKSFVHGHTLSAALFRG